ncbi:MAG TPA: glucuronate isomerase [Vicinamibacterales bacterium]|nr:glucuronate isomerase [Vicinamibacterales bacterium]
MPFINDSFLLGTKAARRLYDAHAAHQPILDYHCHLPPRDIADDRRFANLFEIWLEGDHYKWRAMRANGAAERFCTGDADPYEKFLAWAATVPHCLRNPLYHWTHLELQRYFGIDELLNEKTAPGVWTRANERLQSPELSARGILKKFDVKAVCTTDDPADDLSSHVRIRDAGIATRVYPTFRPDRVLDVHQPDVFNPWVDRLSNTADVHIARFQDLLDALNRRHQAFHDLGCRLSDHGLDQCFAEECSDDLAAAIFAKARAGNAVSLNDRSAFASSMMVFFGRLDAEKGWTKQLHLGARRNANTRGLRALGRDVGFDSMGDWPQMDALGAYLDRLDRDGALPKTIVYNNNPTDNYAMATMVGNFQDGSAAGKIQFGTSWWFLDQKEGIEWQLNALSNCGLLSRFVGMVTDSRSFMSYPRHEYFRRVLCNLLGRDMEKGILPGDEALIGKLVEDVCYGNASRYFGLGLPAHR